MSQKRRHNVVSILILLAFLIPVAAVYAGEGEEAIGQGKLKPGEMTSPTDAFSKMLSGRMWLITSGLDPVLSRELGDVKEAPASSGGGSPAAQAGGGGAVMVPYRDPSAKFSRNVLIPTDFSSATYQTEPSLAVDPKDPDHILVGMIDYNFPNMVTYSSIDGGATWKGPNRARYPRQDMGAAGDPIVAFDSKGKAYYAYISLDVDEYTVGNILGQALVSAISISTSPDGGETWENPVQSSRSGVTTRNLPSSGGRQRGEIESRFLDKPWMAIGRSPTLPDKDVIYVVYTNFIETAALYWVDELPFVVPVRLETVIESVCSMDGGVTWSKPIEVSPRAKYTILLNQSTDGSRTKQELGPASGPRKVVQGPDVDVAPDGTVYVTWLDTTDDDTFEGRAEIYVSRSDDAGVTFKRPKRAASFLEPGFRSRDHAFRSWSSAFPKLGIGPKGEVYVAYVGIPTDNPEDDGDVYMVSSTNKGDTWGRRIRVNDDETGSFQFFPEVAVDPKGTIHAMWGDFRDDPTRVRFHIYNATSENGGQTWSRNSRVTDFGSNPSRAFPGGRFIGDYFAIAATGEEVYMVWADGRLGEFGSPNQKIAFARKKLMPTPSILISPPSGAGGKDVIVQGFNFQPDREVFIEVAGVIVSASRTQADGRFSTRFFIPIAGRGAHTVRAIEESGNVASSSFFMDFGFDTIQEATDKLDEVLSRLDALQQKAGLPAGSVPAAVAITTPVAASKGGGGISCGLSPAGGGPLVGADGLALVGLMMAGLYVRNRRSRR
ncbi:MAG: exo-alpha-sialidase [Dehalococcoidia bacterium]|nr:exo-alpha-sialidase [Dehalococcoidia bacterium]